MKLTRFLLSAVFILTSFVSASVTRAEAESVSFSRLSFIFDSGYLIDASLEQFPGSEALSYASEKYPGVILAGSRFAVLTTLSDVPEVEHQIVLHEVFCTATSSIVVAYGEDYEYEVRLVHVLIDGDVLTFTTRAVQRSAEQQSCR